MLKKKNIKIHDLIDVVITVLDARDPYTFLHSERVAMLSVIIAETMNFSRNSIEKIHVAAHLHDIGKIGVPDRILNKPGKLTREEMIQLQSHSEIGYNILKRLSLFSDIADIILHHHERDDGLGYPSGLKGKEIPIESSIIAVADAFDAMTSDRTYRRGMTYKEGFKEVDIHKGDQFSPDVVGCFMMLQERIPAELDKFESKEITHIAFVGHEDLMHSRKVL